MDRMAIHQLLNVVRVSPTDDRRNGNAPRKAGLKNEAVSRFDAVVRELQVSSAKVMDHIVFVDVHARIIKNKVRGW